MAQALRSMFLKLSGAIVSIVGVIMIGIVFFASEAKGQVRPQFIINPPPVQIFPWGSMAALQQFAATNTQNMGVEIYQGNINGGQADFQQNIAFGNVANINAAFQEILLFTANLALTNSRIDKTQPVFISGDAWNYNYPPPNGVVGTFFTPWDPVPSFSFVKTNGVWTIPDLSGISMILPEQMVFYVPGMEWARIEVYSNTDLTTPFLVVDSSSNPSSFDAVIDTTNQSLTIDTPYLASGTNGLYRLKVNFLTSSGFTIADGNGNKVAETPFQIENISVRKGVVSLNVVGGNTGRVFFVQRSPDLVHWVTAGGPYTVNGNPIPFQEPSVATASPLEIQNFVLGTNRTVSFNVVGGQTNSIPFEIMKSFDLRTWFPVSAPQYRSNTNPIPFSESIGPATPNTSGFFTAASVAEMFYRTVTTNSVP